MLLCGSGRRVASRVFRLRRRWRIGLGGGSSTWTGLSGDESEKVSATLGYLKVL